MFFRREKPRATTFSDRLDRLKEAGFTVQSAATGTSVIKHGSAAVLQDRGDSTPAIGKAGVMIGNELGHLVNCGYQQFFITPSGRKVPALAQQLRAVHDFQEDLKEALGLESLYNTSLGTISDEHLYDRVENRDSGHKKSLGGGTHQA